MSDQILSTLQTPEEVRKVVAKSHGQSSSKAECLLSLTDFFTLLVEMLKIDCPDAVIVPSFPKYLKPDTPEFKATFENPTEKFRRTITYEVMRREPATMGGNKQPFGTGVKSYVPRFRETVGNEDGTQTQIFGQWFDNLVKFKTWTLTSVEAEELVNWFEQYLRDRRNFFRDQGLNEILFWVRGEEKEVPILNNGLEQRTLTFYVRTEELSIVQESVLKDLEVQLGIRAI